MYNVVWKEDIFVNDLSLHTDLGNVLKLIRIHSVIELTFCQSKVLNSMPRRERDSYLCCHFSNGSAIHNFYLVIRVR
jgi:hypothetical protein